MVEILDVESLHTNIKQFRIQFRSHNYFVLLQVILHVIIFLGLLLTTDMGHRCMPQIAYFFLVGGKQNMCSKRNWSIIHNKTLAEIQQEL
ncbi:hypothetical protein GDO81_020921 [Engystomops pustulosus]|uniref:Uncharacterized protein n=1 Tax=Engystomops pustulosus TaxID=76066 RepID=A0AAV6ZAQ3_ENGPU|nr:hypothetical protein GDO81_020921 [Engystomops pustulosus]